MATLTPNGVLNEESCVGPLKGLPFRVGALQVYGVQGLCGSSRSARHMNFGQWVRPSLKVFSPMFTFSAGPHALHALLLLFTKLSRSSRGPLPSPLGHVDETHGGGSHRDTPSYQGVPKIGPRTNQGVPNVRMEESVTRVLTHMVTSVFTVGDRWPGGVGRQRVVTRVASSRSGRRGGAAVVVSGSKDL